MRVQQTHGKHGEPIAPGVTHVAALVEPDEAANVYAVAPRIGFHPRGYHVHGGALVPQASEELTETFGCSGWGRAAGHSQRVLTPRRVGGWGGGVVSNSWGTYRSARHLPA